MLSQNSAFFVEFGFFAVAPPKGHALNSLKTKTWFVVYRHLKVLHNFPFLCYKGFTLCGGRQKNYWRFFHRVYIPFLGAFQALVYTWCAQGGG